MSNLGTIVELETFYETGVGLRFNYMFFEMATLVKGYPYMRKVVIIDGTQLKGKYAGCLLTLTTQDGKYNIFPLVFVVVDSKMINL